MDTNTEVNNPEEQQEVKHGHKVMRISLIVAMIITVAAISVGYYYYSDRVSENEERLYERAMQSTEPAILQQYLDFYPEAPKAHRDSVEAHLPATRQHSWSVSSADILIMCMCPTRVSVSTLWTMCGLLTVAP